MPPTMPGSKPGAGVGRGPIKNPFSNPGAPGTDDEVFEEDFSDVEPGFTLISAQVHYAFVKELEKNESSGGNPQFQWDFTVVTPETMDYGKNLRQWTSMVPAARFRVVEYLEAMGIPAGGKVAKFKRSDVIGKAVILEVGHEKYIDKNGQERTSARILCIAPGDDDCKAAVDAYHKAKANTPG